MFQPQQVVELLKPASGSHILDLATGHGDTAMALAEAGCLVTAVDSSSKAVEKCKEIAQEKHLSGVTAQVMDAEQLSFQDKKFDGVTCRLATHHFNNVPLVLEQIAAVLKENAPVIIGDRLAPEDTELADFLALIGKLRDCTFTRIFTLKEWKKLLSDHGLKVVDYNITKDTIDATRWLERSPLSDEEKQRIHQAFIDSSPKMKEYFCSIFDKGKIISYTDDKILIKAIRA